MTERITDRHAAYITPLVPTMSQSEARAYLADALEDRAEMKAEIERLRELVRTLRKHGKLYHVSRPCPKSPLGHDTTQSDYRRVSAEWNAAYDAETEAMIQGCKEQTP